jgi:hypothetical protein
VRHNSGVALSSHDRKILWSLSGNACAHCRAQLVEAPAAAGDLHAIIGRECHIVARAPLGPRGSSGSRQDLDGYDNLILLCANCHAVVDGQPDRFTPEELRRIKSDHEQRIRSQRAPSILDISLRGRDEPIQLQPIASGDALLRLLGPSYSWVHDYPDGLWPTQRELVGCQATFAVLAGLRTLGTTAQRLCGSRRTLPGPPLVGDFLQACQVGSEAYDDIGPNGYLDGGQHLQEHINSLLVDENLATYAAKRQLTLAGNGSELPWAEAVVKVIDVHEASTQASATSSLA